MLCESHIWPFLRQPRHVREFRARSDKTLQQQAGREKVWGGFCLYDGIVWISRECTRWGWLCVTSGLQEASKQQSPMGRVTTSATTMHSFNLICSMSTAAHAAKVIFNDRLIRGRYILCKSVPQTERSFLGDCLADTGQESQTDIVSSCPMVGIFSSYLSTCIQCASSVSIISTASTSIRIISTSAVLTVS